MSTHRSVLMMGAAALALTLGLSGCGGSVASDTVEEQISNELGKQIGEAPKKVDCPNDLDAEVGAEERCTLTAPDGEDFGVVVKVTEVDGDDVLFDITLVEPED